ncbi:MAG: tRNA (cytidine(56)-2'-O)-methyltransferase [ANME-2 cluster archaeon]|nr:tRNA (cytidine(56)-2'-O)-methyltransferase [ANME-2 cluster archaeon]MDF1556819.1 tRNA (cytidine(56)-2'-O)-methyltransferase [ANME-2 cluster archaeon]
MNIIILRLGHRPERDQRVTTHVGLTARAMGAGGMLLASNDKGVIHSLNEVVQRWGGNFFARSVDSWKQEVHNWKEVGGRVVHLTMYGQNLPDVMDDISKEENLMVVVGAQKVPPDIYQIADWNVAVGSQPHSEIAALAVFLDRVNAARGTEPLTKEFPGGKLKIVPHEQGKVVKEV